MFQATESERGLDAIDELMGSDPAKWTSHDGSGLLSRRNLARFAAPAVTVMIIVVALLVLQQALAEVRFADVWHAAGSIKWSNLALSIGLVALSYLFLTGYDEFGLRYVGKRLPYPRVAMGSFISYAFANNLGFALLTGGSVRYRIYSPSGVSTADVAILTVMAGITFILSATLVIGLCLLLAPAALAAMTGLPIALNVLLGTVLLTTLGVYIGWVGSGTGPKSLQWGSWKIDMPGVTSTLAQFAVGCGDIVCAAAALYVLLPTSTTVDFWVFVGVFAAAITLGLISSIPGGVGVFEGIILFAVPNATADQLLASLLVFRCVYYLLPLLCALALLLWHEMRAQDARAGWQSLLRNLGRGQPRT
jgi:glycosyltransferase 2 family protein